MEGIKIAVKDGDAKEGQATLATDTEQQRKPSSDSAVLEEINCKLDLLLSASGISA